MMTVTAWAPFRFIFWFTRLRPTRFSRTRLLRFRRTRLLRLSPRRFRRTRSLRLKTGIFGRAGSLPVMPAGFGRTGLTVLIYKYRGRRTRLLQRICQGLELRSHWFKLLHVHHSFSFSIISQSIFLWNFCKSQQVKCNVFISMFVSLKTFLLKLWFLNTSDLSISAAEAMEEITKI